MRTRLSRKQENCGRKIRPQTKQVVLKYLRSFNNVAVAAGYPEDVVTGEIVRIPYLAFEDDEYCWDSSDIYHLEKYDIALDPEFVDKVLAVVAVAQEPLQ